MVKYMLDRTLSRTAAEWARVAERAENLGNTLAAGRVGAAFPATSARFTIALRRRPRSDWLRRTALLSQEPPRKPWGLEHSTTPPRVLAGAGCFELLRPRLRRLTWCLRPTDPWRGRCPFFASRSASRISSTWRESSRVPQTSSSPWAAEAIDVKLTSSDYNSSV